MFAASAAPDNTFDPAVYQYVSAEGVDGTPFRNLISEPNLLTEVGLVLKALIPVIIAVVVVAVIIGLLLQLKSGTSPFTVAVGKASEGPSWLDNIVSSFNDVESERLLNKMFPGGFQDVVDSVEKAYKSYRGIPEYSKQ